MYPGQKRLLALIGAIIFVVAAVWLGLFAAGAVSSPGPDQHFKMSDRLADLEVVETEGGKRFRFDDELVSADEFAAEIERRQRGRGPVFRALNITSTTGLLWVGLGLLGQVLFTGRMIVQWLASEKEKRSVVPDVFWWMSLGGATMLIIYFIWRVDIVGIIGQSTGWFIYVRNLWFIYGRKDA